jgi:hypothetical protein
MDADADRFLTDVKTLLSRPYNKEWTIRKIDDGVLKLFSRCYSATDAIHLLLQHAHPEEAMDLARGLFTDSLRLQKLSAAGEDRGDYLLDWEYGGLADWDGIVAEAHRVGLEPNPDQRKAAIAVRRSQIDRYAQRHQMSRKSFGDEKQLAKEFGREDELVEYKMSHQFVHGGPYSQSLKTSGMANKTLLIFLRNEDPQIIRGVAGFSGCSALHAYHALSETLPEIAPPTDHLNALLRESDKLRSP